MGHTEVLGREGLAQAEADAKPGLNHVADGLRMPRHSVPASEHGPKRGFDLSATIARTPLVPGGPHRRDPG